MHQERKLIFKIRQINANTQINKDEAIRKVERKPGESGLTESKL